MRIEFVKLFDDNYSYLLTCEKTKEAAIVDPAEPDVVLKFLKDKDINLTTLLTTHHHWDHSGGNEKLKEAYPDLEVVGFDEDRIPALTKPMGDKDSMKVGSLNIQAFHTPCHTSNHLLYLVTDDSDDPPAVFTGDTLFVGGCGRFFEGDAKQMHHALNNVCASLPKETLVYCGHEYTVKNLQFALTVDGDNADLQEKYKWAKSQRESSKPTIPSTIESELATNPFMRVDKPALQQATGETDAEQVMARVRALKDKF